MNNLLQLKGTFDQRKNDPGFGPPQLPTNENGFVESQKIEQLENDLLAMLEFWTSNKWLKYPLISVYYHDVVAKSNRIGTLLKTTARPQEYDIVGAKFNDNLKDPYHIITHRVTMQAIKDSVSRLRLCRNILKANFNDCINYEQLAEITEKKEFTLSSEIGKTKFAQTIKDAFYVKRFGVHSGAESLRDESAIVTLYDVGFDVRDALSKIDISVSNERYLDHNTFLFNRDDLRKLKANAPYLIAMAVEDMSELSAADFNVLPPEKTFTIPDPKDEPTIGVIDTLFDKSVYFSKWVEYKEMLAVPTEGKDYIHGTEVSSIIVDGASINPELDDGCGRFKVRHFGVATAGEFSSFAIVQSIRRIVAANSDIKVWNLSLGSNQEVNHNFISPEAAVLDQIQSEFDVIFVVSGTNKNQLHSDVVSVGSPADSINSLVVNSVKLDGNPASYSRSGPILSFFRKPDVVYYGGDDKEEIRVCSPSGERHVKGTSFATPWMSRKIAYLIYVMGLSKEAAKALVIDSATGWTSEHVDVDLLGYGKVPVRIEDVLKCKDDEIRFILTGAAEEYETYTYKIPVPIVNNKFPYLARATLCYFPECSRSQGVDYTNTELDIKFGRLKTVTKDKKGQKVQVVQIASINNNRQDEGARRSNREVNARRIYRKWDNVKQIGETLKGRLIPRKSYEDFWGMSIKIKERLATSSGRGMNFGVIITLKEMGGVNRLKTFVDQCRLHGWIVNEIDIDSQVEVYVKGEEDLTFSE